MARITLTNKSQVTRKTVSQGTGDKLLLSRGVYQYLGSLKNCKNIVYDYDNGNIPGEIKEFIDRMSEIYDGTASSDIVAIDEYLGSLGETEHYPYSKDATNIPAWVGIGDRVQTRYLVDGDNVIMFNNDVLVRNV